MMWTLLYFTCFTVFIVDIQLTAAQLPQTETLVNIKQCDLKADINVTCATNEMIAIHSLQYAYDARCDGICCDYSSNDCLQYADVTDIQTIRRLCSGRQSCTLPDLSDRISFDSCSLSVQDVSYVFLQYYCIPKNRITSICSSGVLLTSDNAPLYVTNNNYPSVTTGSTSCSCSLEVYSCSSSINIYIVDADLYLDTNNCEQNIEFLDGSDQKLSTIDCGSHYKDQIEITTASSHYAKIDFINNSTQNQEGYFFIGLEGSESGVSFNLSCNYEQEMWCIGCGDVPTITKGKIELQNANDSSYGAQANVVCDSGYETNTSTISCLADGTWPSAACTEKAACTANQWRCTNGDCILQSVRCDSVPDDCADGSDELNCNAEVCLEDLKSCPQANGTTVCVDKTVNCTCGSVPSIDNGVITAENSTIGSVANVTCNEGFDPSNDAVTCLTSGQWETATCTATDCGPLQNLNFGQYKLTDTNNTTFGATASVECIIGYDASKQIVTCQSSGIWESAVCKIRDCGSLQNLNFGQYKLTDINNTTFGATATIDCNIGYEASKLFVTCQSTGVWESAVCTVRDCGTPPNVAHGNVILNANNRTTFEAAASVTCEDGYEPKFVTIMCQSSGNWQTPLCEIKGRTTPAGATTTNKKSTMNTILIIIISVLGTLLLIQFAVMCFLQCKIHGIRNKAQGGDTEVPKRIGMTLLGSVPVLGIIPIYLTWKVFYRDVYQVTHGHHNIRMNTNGVCHAISNNTYSGASLNRAETPTHEVHTDHIMLEHQETDSVTENNTDKQRGNSTLNSSLSNQQDGSLPGSHESSRSTITRGISAVAVSDEKDDMSLERKVQHKYQPMPPIGHHPDDKHQDGHHHHFSKPVEKRREELKPIMEQARREGKHAEIHRDKLYIDNCLYHPEEHIKPSHTKTSQKDMFY